MEEECAIHNGTVISALEHAHKLFARQNCRPSLSLSLSLPHTHTHTHTHTRTHAHKPHPLSLSLSLYLCLFVVNFFTKVSCQFYLSSFPVSLLLSTPVQSLFNLLQIDYLFFSFLFVFNVLLPFVYLSLSDSLLIIPPITQSQSRFCPSDFKGCHWLDVHIL